MDLLFQVKRGNKAVGENKGNDVYSITKKSYTAPSSSQLITSSVL
jgi:hypothetical protein